MSYAHQIRSAVRATVIHSDTVFSWFGRRSFRLPTRTLTAFSIAERRRYLKATIQNQLYSYFYCLGEATPSIEENEPPGMSGGDPNFQQRLSEANRGTGHLDPGWIVRSVEDSHIAVLKDGLELLVGREQCVPSRLVLEGNEVSLKASKELLGISPGFYMAVANAPGYLAAHGEVIRLYWNLVPTGTERLIYLTTSRLNELKVPFRLKVLTDPSAYVRNDSAVLYLPLSKYELLRPVLEDIHLGVSEFMRYGVPALTKTLARGLGLAEDPGSDDTSFGFHRCGLMADGMVNAWEAGAVSDIDCFEEVRSRFEADGLSIDRPYLNSDSDESYEFTHRDVQVSHVESKAVEAHPVDRGEDCLTAAHQIGIELVRTAVWHTEQCTWFGYFADRPDGDELKQGVYSTLGTNLYTGTAGVAHFLTELYRATGDEEIRNTALGSMKHSLFQSEHSPADHSLFTGSAGIAWSGAYLGEVLESDELADHSLRLARTIASPQVLDGEFDIMSGDAGTIIALLSLWDIYKEDFLVTGAIRFGDHLLQSARTERGGYAWRSKHDRQHPSLAGLSHGAAGVAWALAELYDVVGDKRYSSACLRAVEYERSWFDADIGNWPDLRHAPSRTRTHSQETPLPFASYWCHGAPGIALSRIRAHEVLGDEVYRDDALTALSTTDSAAKQMIDQRISDFSLCHGLAGMGLILLHGSNWRSVNAPGRFRSTAQMIARTGIRTYGGSKASWPGGAGPGGNPSLMLGLAGIGYFLLCVDSSVLGRTPIMPRRTLSERRI